MALTQDKRNLLFLVGALLTVMALFQFASYNILLDTHEISHKAQKGQLRIGELATAISNATLHKRVFETEKPGGDEESAHKQELDEAESLALERDFLSPARCKGGLCTFFDITINSSYVGRIVFLLHGKKRPKAAENFRALSTGEKGLSSSGTKLHYKGTTFSRIVHNILVQGGDIHGGRASEEEKESIYGKAFNHEGLDELHERGLLAMAGQGKGGSEFFITLDSVAELDNQYVVFGEVEEGIDVVDQISNVQVDHEGQPILSVSISDCGQL